MTHTPSDVGWKVTTCHNTRVVSLLWLSNRSIYHSNASPLASVQALPMIQTIATSLTQLSHSAEGYAVFTSQDCLMPRGWLGTAASLHCQQWHCSTAANPAVQDPVSGNHWPRRGCPKPGPYTQYGPLLQENPQVQSWSSSWAMILDIPGSIHIKLAAYVKFIAVHRNHDDRCPVLLHPLQFQHLKDESFEVIGRPLSVHGTWPCSYQAI